MADKYGNGLKCDFVQLPHHGHGSGGGTVPEFYEGVRATYALYPNEKYAPGPTEEKGIEIARKYFLAGDGNAVFDLPYHK